MTENDGLSNGNHAVNILYRLILFVLVLASDVVLFDVFKRFLLFQQTNYDRVFDDVFGELHHRSIVCCRKEHHLAFW